jgi:cytochrome b
MTVVWDLPTRAFHWLLASAVTGLLVTGQVGGDSVMVWHGRLGCCVGALLLFRLAWGFAGGYWSRFSSFPVSIAAAAAHVRSRGHIGAVGHSPLAALSVYSMLAFLALQVASGLFSETKEDFAGPLTSLVSNATVHFTTGYHKRVGQWVLISLVTLHVTAVAFYFWTGRNLVNAMFHGRQAVACGTPATRDDWATRLIAVLVMSLCSLVMWGITKLGN